MQFSPCRGIFGVRVHVEHNMSIFMLSTGSWRANAPNSGLSQQIGAFHVTRLTMILSTSPTPPVVNQTRWKVQVGPYTGQMSLRVSPKSLLCSNPVAERRIDIGGLQSFEHEVNGTDAQHRFA